MLSDFGSQAWNSVDASSLEPVDLFRHLTQLSTQLAVENQANQNRAALVQTGLQRMVVERSNLDQANQLLTDEYPQLHSDTPNRSALADRHLEANTFSGECSGEILAHGN